MNLEVYNYLKEYIRKNYPMYYDSNNQAKFMSFLRMIASDPSFKEKIKEVEAERSVKELLSSGELDGTIDNLVITYAQVEYTNIWANFGALCDYVKKVVLANNREAMRVIGDKNIDIICRDIALRVSRVDDSTDGLDRNDEIDYSRFMNGSYNDIFIRNFDYHCDRLYNKVYKYIKDFVSKIDSRVLFSNDNVCQIIIGNTCVSILIEVSDVDEVLSGKYDEQIKKRAIYYLKKLKYDVKNHVQTVLNNMIDLFGVPVDVVVKDALNKVLVTGEWDVNELLVGKLDGLIKSQASKRRAELDPSKAIRYIKNRISVQNYVDMSSEELDEIAREICTMLHENHKHSYEEIVAGKDDELIGNIFSRKLIEYNSVLNEEVVGELEYKPKKKRISKLFLSLVLLALVAVLGAGSLIYSVGSSVVNRISTVITDFRNADEVKVVDEFDGYDYSNIFTTNTDAYKPTARNVLSFYSKLADNGYDGTEYDYLGFYRAYLHVLDDRLDIMDSMLDLVQIEAGDNPEYREFYDSICFNTCYLDFACDRLEEMGCTEIRNEKYMSVLDAYEEAVWKYPSEEPYYKLTKSQQEVVQEIMNLYREYSKQLQVKFGNALLGGKSVDSGRAV